MDVTRQYLAAHDVWCRVAMSRDPRETNDGNFADQSDSVANGGRRAPRDASRACTLRSRGKYLSRRCFDKSTSRACTANMIPRQREQLTVLLHRCPWHQGGDRHDDWNRSI